MKENKIVLRSQANWLIGSATVEMSYLIPFVFLVILLTVYATFYYHDKNILLGAAAETAIVMAQSERMQNANGQTDMQSFFQSRVAGKLIFFDDPEVETEVSGKKTKVTVCAERGKMKIKLEQQAAITETEKLIRKKMILEKLAEDYKEKQELKQEE